MKKWLVLLVVMVVVLGAGQMFLQWTEELLQPVDATSADWVTFEIPPGTSTREVAEALYARKLIRNPLAFRLFARQHKLDSQLHSGEYRLSPGMKVAEILDKFAKGQVVIHRFTIPEGMSVAQVAQLLGQQGVLDPERFLAAARASQINREWLPQEAPVLEPLEGYLFPSTYEYKPGISSEELIERMVRQTEAVFRPAYRQRADELKLNLHQVLTLASIVEKEAVLPAERPRIAGVYWNRIKEEMRLDADPTVAYGLQKSGEDLTLADLKADHAYNTYRHHGLPPGPIANPGEAAIQAVLWPEEHAFFYFVAKAGGDGEHLFSRTLDEHEQRVADQRR